MFARTAIVILAIAAIVALADLLIFRRQRTAAAGPPLGVLGKLVYIVTFLAFLVLACTGFMPTINPLVSMRGWLLIIHCLAAPVFCIGMGLVALMWADHARLSGGPSPLDTAQKLFFWFSSILALVVIASALAGFMPWFAAPGQLKLLAIHRSAALGLVVSMCGQVYLFTIGRPSQSPPARNRVLGGAEINW